MKKILIIVFVLSYFAGYGEEDYLSKYTEGINELKRVLIENSIPEKWINDGIYNNNFKIYEEISKYYENKAKLDYFHFHMLKHSIAVHLLEIWLSIFEVKNYLWHKSINSTMVYSSFSSVMNKEMYEKINKWWLV